LFWDRIQGLFESGYGLFSLGFLGQFCMCVSLAHKDRSIRVTFKNYLNTCSLNFGSLWWLLLLNFFSFNVWEWFLHFSVLERTESDLSKINWFRGVILLIPIVLVPWGRFPLCHTPIRLISAFQDQISILIVGCVTTWSRGSHQFVC
jgi:Na+/proline symporter